MRMELYRLDGVVNVKSVAVNEAERSAVPFLSQNKRPKSRIDIKGDFGAKCCSSIGPGLGISLLDSVMERRRRHMTAETVERSDEICHDRSRRGADR
jgi:hypothetical protein